MQQSCRSLTLFPKVFTQKNALLDGLAAEWTNSHCLGAFTAKDEVMTGQQHYLSERVITD